MKCEDRISLRNLLTGALPELTLTLPPQVPHQPMGVESILRRHAPAHDGVEEGFPLASVEPQDLVMTGSIEDMEGIMYAYWN